MPFERGGVDCDVSLFDGGTTAFVGILEFLGEEIVGNRGKFTSFDGDEDVFDFLNQGTIRGVEEEVDRNVRLIGEMNT